MSISYIFTARKRSFGQGNMFTVVCLSTGGGVWSQGVPCHGGVWSQGGGCSSAGVPGPGGFGPRGVPGPAGSVPRGVAAPQRGCLVMGGVPGPGGCGPRGCLVESPPYTRLLLRAVIILLECILVIFTVIENCWEDIGDSFIMNIYTF